jgi:tRNA1(Val) A37 N6-methylase TrmN6
VLGFRTGIEPVLLAASVPAAPGDHVVEAGTGAGAGLLCMMARVPGLHGLGLERDAAMAALARRNLAANGFAATAIETADVTAWRSDAPQNHAFANPPWHHGGTPSPHQAREDAKRARPGLLHDWAAALSRGLARRGTLSFIVAAAAAAEAIDALAAARCRELVLIPLWPHAGQAAKLVIVRGIRDGRGGTIVHPGVVLHEPDGFYTDAASAILRGGATL